MLYFYVVLSALDTWKQMKNETLYILYYFKKKSLGNNSHMINSRTILQNLIREKKYWY